MLPATEAQSLNHWTTREVPHGEFLNELIVIQFIKKKTFSEIKAEFVKFVCKPELQAVRRKENTIQSFN